MNSRHITNRWTGAAGVCFASNSVRRRLREIAPPGQLCRYAIVGRLARRHLRIRTAMLSSPNSTRTTLDSPRKVFRDFGNEPRLRTASRAKSFSLDLAKPIRVGHVVNRTGDRPPREVSAGSASPVRPWTARSGRPSTTSGVQIAGSSRLIEPFHANSPLGCITQPTA